MKKNKIIGVVVAVLTATILLLESYVIYKETGKIDTDKISEAVETVVNEINTYEMSEEEVKELASTEIVEQTEEQENTQEQEVESEAFELQGEIAYEGDRATTWDVELGDYKSLVYYSQLDGRWSRKNVQFS